MNINKIIAYLMVSSSVGLLTLMGISCTVWLIVWTILGLINGGVFRGKAYVMNISKILAYLMVSSSVGLLTLMGISCAVWIIVWTILGLINGEIYMANLVSNIVSFTIIIIAVKTLIKITLDLISVVKS